jgi:DNA-binding CsgD family transcriptional regulator
MVKPLTSAERHLVELAARGLSNQELALLRGSSTRTVEKQLSAAYRKLGVMSRRELRALLNRPSALKPETPAHSLSAREQRVLHLVEAGHSNKLIAHSLGVAVSTVSTVLTRGRRKLGQDTPR